MTSDRTFRRRAAAIALLAAAVLVAVVVHLATRGASQVVTTSCQVSNQGNDFKPQFTNNGSRTVYISGAEIAAYNSSGDVLGTAYVPAPQVQEVAVQASYVSTWTVPIEDFDSTTQFSSPQDAACAVLHWTGGYAVSQP